jgi:mannan endo-1,4-beta-mannosidase
MTDDGQPFLAIGHNDAMPWHNLWHMHHELDVATTEAYIKMLAEHNVTVLRIMLEYCQDDCWYFEDPVGQPVPDSVLYWDDLIGLCERYKVRLLVQFWDTFFMSRRWERHPYSRPGSGFDGPGSFCVSPTAIEAEKRRIKFFVDRWGDSPAIFAYDLLNEIHPYWGGTPQDQYRWVTEMARFVKQYEMERWGKRHLLTVSVFGSRPEGGYDDLILRHHELDFASTHVYEFGQVDNPENTVDCALVMRSAVRFAFSQMADVRPYTDSESGPIHLYMDLKRQLEDSFEMEYYHNMSWAHLATGGAGSGMRWPFRDPHALTPGMHAVQKGMARFVSDCGLDWLRFSPQPIDHLLRLTHSDPTNSDKEAREVASLIPFGCSDGEQALIWLLRDCRTSSVDEPLPPIDLLVPQLQSGEYVISFWETYRGVRKEEHRLAVPETRHHAPSGSSMASATNRLEAGVAQIEARDQAAAAYLRLPLPPFTTDLAITIRPA